MKRRILSLLVLLCMSISSIVSWAERVAPTIPSVELESEAQYYLYNVEAQLFLQYSGTSIKFNADPSALKFLLNDKGLYAIQIDGAIGLLYSASSAGCNANSVSYNENSSYCQWKIEATGTGEYLIQRSPSSSYYSEGEYLGWQGDNSVSVLPNRPITDGVHWKLIPADATGDRFVASLKLYKALNMADAFVENGWNIDYYVELYNKRAIADVEELTQASYALRNGLNMSTGYKAPYWNEYPILWQTPDGSFGQNKDYTWALPDNSHTTGSYFYSYVPGGSSRSLSATVKVNELSTFVYSLSGSSSNSLMQIYVDNELVRTLQSEQLYTYPSSKTYTRFFEVLQPGTHTVKFVATSSESSSSYSSHFYVRTAGVINSPLITVSLLEPGSLGNEVLYNTDHIKNVRRLKIKGKMNDDDWAKIKMMPHLLELDLSDAEISEIPKAQFSCDADTASLFLHSINLPEGLKKINDEAFYYSFIDNMVFPSTVQTVGKSAFGYSHIKELNLPDNLTDIYGGSTSYRYYASFSYMYWLEGLKCPKNLETIPASCFCNNYYCGSVVLPEKIKNISSDAFYANRQIKVAFPEGLQTIKDAAFSGCNRGVFSALPESLTEIGSNAFYNCNGIKSVVIPKNVNSLGSYAYENCSSLTDVEVGVGVYNLSSSVFSGCPIKTIRLNSPTLVTYEVNSSSYPIDASRIKNVSLVVPNHLITSYKLDNYWYNFKSIEGFSSLEIQNWTINNPLVLNRDRLEGTPSIRISGGKDRKPSLKINGDNPMTINDLRFSGSRSDTYYNYPGQILSNCDNIFVTGKVSTVLWCKAKYWYFYSLPFDIKISEITHSEGGVQKAVRYYDGANRAENGNSGSWKNYDADAVIPAGTGFIMQTNVDTWNYFYALDNASKQQCVKNVEFVQTLAVNDCETKSNKGWNLVGNPWQCYYNNHSLNFTGPITIWNVKNKTYTAYSITDDDYAICPNEAFFVQCPDAEHNTIGFPTNGRQLTDVIDSQNAAKLRSTSFVERQLVNVKISDGENEDQTRVVLNDNASMGYEMQCDASKMMSMEASVPQIYSLGSDDTQYAINERPVDNGIVGLGFYVAKSGEYMIKLGRTGMNNVTIIDYETGIEQTLADGYAFTSAAGFDNSRFALHFVHSNATDIKSNSNEYANSINSCYNLNGQRVSRNTKGIIIIDGKKVFNK